MAPPSTISAVLRRVSGSRAPVAGGDIRVAFAFGPAHGNSSSEPRFAGPRLSIPPQLQFGFEPMCLGTALFLSARHPNLVGPCPDCCLRWGRFLGLQRIE